MKQFFLMLALVAFSVSKMNAQTLGLHGHNQCDVMYVVVYAYNTSTCTLVGQTNPIAVAPLSNQNFNSPWPGGFWNVNPSGCGCNWEFLYADVFRDPTCGPSASSPGCISGNVDMLTIGAPGSCTTGYPSNDCFEVSIPCGTCGPGTVVTANCGGGPAFELHVDN